VNRPRIVLCKPKQVCWNTGRYRPSVRVRKRDPHNQFRPSAGTVELINMPGGYGVRIDTAIFNGCEISPYYDSMIAKVIVHGSTRLGAMRRMRRVLE